MVQWADRSPIPATMLNPTLLAMVIGAAASGYERETQTAMPWPLCFIAAPLVLHRGTREALPGAISSHLHVWVSRQPSVRSGFPARARSLVRPVREGLRFGLRHGLLIADATGVRSGDQRLRFDNVGDIREIARRALFVGRWFTKADQPATIFALLGVRP